MIDLLIVAARFVQFSAAAILFGSPLFFVYALDVNDRTTGAAPAWAPTLVRLSGGVLILAALTSLFAQTAAMAGGPDMGFDHDALGMVLGGTQFGYAIMARLGLAVIVLGCGIWLPPGRRLCLVAVGIGALILASFAWTGHGASEEGLAGALHAASDVVHLIAAGVWLGAVATLAGLLWRSRPASDRAARVVLHKALERFSGLGSLVVAALLASGLINSWYLVGLVHLNAVFTSPYGWVLITKIGLFGMMLLLASANRFHLTPALGRAMNDEVESAAALRALRRSVLVEAALGVGVLVLVSTLGMLAPVAAQT